MRYQWKKFYFAMSLAFAVIALGIYAYLTISPTPAYHLANGIGVTAVPVVPSDTDRLLEVMIWKFDVYLPDKSKPVFLSFSQYREGKFVKTVVGGVEYGPALTPDQQEATSVYHVVVGIVPIGNTIMGAKQLKFSIASQGAAVSGVMPNIFLNGHGSTTGSEVSTADNLVYLLSTNQKRPYVSSTAAMNDTALALSISTKPPK